MGQNPTTPPATAFQPPQPSAYRQIQVERPIFTKGRKFTPLWILNFLTRACSMRPCEPVTERRVLVLFRFFSPDISIFLKSFWALRNLKFPAKKRLTSSTGRQGLMEHTRKIPRHFNQKRCEDFGLSCGKHV